MKNITSSTKGKEIRRTWHHFDVKNEVLGRMATVIAHTLMGKSKPKFVRNMDCGDYVVVTNAKFVSVTGKKEVQKMYSRFSGYPGGLKKIPFWKMQQQNPSEIVRHAVWGMLPKNKLRDRLMTRLFIFPEEDHPYRERFAGKGDAL